MRLILYTVLIFNALLCRAESGLAEVYIVTCSADAGSFKGPSAQAACDDALNAAANQFAAQPEIAYFSFSGPLLCTSEPLPAQGGCSRQGVYGYVDGGGVWSEVLFAAFNAEGYCPPSTIDINGTCQCKQGFTPVYPVGLDPVCFPIREFDLTRKPPICSANPGYGNPIYPVTGGVKDTLTINHAPGWQRIKLTYNTVRHAGVNLRFDLIQTEENAFSEVWYSNLHRRLSNQGTHISISRGDGSLLIFTKDQSGGYRAATGNASRLQASEDGFKLYDADALTIEVYEAGGRLTGIYDRNGSKLQMEYDGDGLRKVNDSYGRFILYEHGFHSSVLDKNLVDRVIDANGYPILMYYYGERYLKQITWQDNQARLFRSDPNIPWAITEISNEYLRPKVRRTYDSAGRALSTISGTDIAGHSVTYTRPPAVAIEEVVTESTVDRTRRWIFPVDPVVTTPSGSTLQLGVSSIEGNPGMTSQSQPAGTGCAASNSSQEFDASGNLLRVDDFNGIRTCYGNDVARHLEIARVEGLPSGTNCTAVTPDGASVPNGSRKTRAQWHPDWPLRIKQAEPGLITHWIYNGQPDPTAGNAIASCAPANAMLPDGKPTAVLCKQVEQATTDSTGALGFNATLDLTIATRKKSWTYNQTGQMLTETDARGGVTTHEYYADTSFVELEGHTAGDLKKSVNPALHVTSYDSYDKAGRLIQSTDANRVVTRNTYTKRGFLSSSSVDGQTTTYKYDAVGNLIEIRQPDLISYVGYEYDDAQRLTAVFNSAGDRMEFTLDPFGNRVEERSKTNGPWGTVRTYLKREVDALGRIQQINGRE